MLDLIFYTRNLENKDIAYHSKNVVKINLVFQQECQFSNDADCSQLTYFTPKIPYYGSLPVPVCITFINNC